MAALTTAALAASLGPRLLGRSDARDRDLSAGPVALEGASVAGGFSFCTAEGERAASAIRATRAHAVLCSPQVLEQLRAAPPPATLLAVERPRLEFIAAVDTHFPGGEAPGGIHPSACVDASAVLGAGVTVGPLAVVEAGARLGPGCRVGAGAVIGGCVILGARTRVEAGAVLGAAGFGFERDAHGRLHRFPQRGRVVVADDVEIGPRVCIDRGALGDTRIGEGTKIDDGAYVAHNVQVEPHCLVMAGVLLCGSAVIEEGAELSPGAVVRDKCRVGRGARVGLGAVVVADVPAGAVVAGVPARALARAAVERGSETDVAR